jgi:tripartite-type tricarboxylate transporter receptor subunit TctC
MVVLVRVILALASVIIALSHTASAKEPWPQHTVRMIVPLSAGAATDLAARLFAERLSQRWGQPVVVENRPGADGIVAVNTFMAANDRHTLLFSFAGPITINPLLHTKLPYDPDQDLVPIAPAIDNFFAFAVARSLGVESIDSFVELAGRHPGKYNWAATPGLPQYIFLALQKRTGIELTEVPYKNVAPMVQDLGEQRVHVVVTGPSALLPPVQAGKARFVMVTNRERSPLAPQVPTASEAGFPELLFEGVVGFYGWRGMPDELRSRIAADVAIAGTDPELVKRLRDVGIVVRTGTTADFIAAIADQKAKVRALAGPKAP